MALVISTPNAFLFDFTEPASGGPDPQTFSGSSGFTFAFTNPADVDVDLDPVTNNMGNLDWFGLNLAIIAPQALNGLSLSGLSTSGGTVSLKLDADFDFYDRLGQGETLVVKWNLTITENNSGQTDTTPVQVTFHGANDLPTAVDDTRAVFDNTSGFDDGTVLADDFDIDIHDDLAISKAVLSGAVTPLSGTVFPVEYVTHAAGAVTRDSDSIQFSIDRYFQFLAANEKATFKIKYTITDGIASATAFLTVTIKGKNTATFAGTNAGEDMLGENDIDTMFGRKGNDKIQARNGGDTLLGEDGGDVLVGGGGADTLWGGKGKDKFDFNAVDETGVGASKRDQIMDFKRGEDQIDLSTIDSGADNGKFSFVGTKALKHAGDLGYQKSGSSIIVSGDTDGDGDADFSILVRFQSAIGKEDFVL